MLHGNSDSRYTHPLINTAGLQIGNTVIITDKMKLHNFYTIQRNKCIEGQTDTLVEFSH